MSYFQGQLLKSWTLRLLLLMQENVDLSHRDVALIEYLDHLYGYAMVLTRNKADAEDLVQETYLRALKAVGDLQTITAMKGWLFTILRNVWLNQRRRRLISPDRMLYIDADENVANLIAKSSKDPYAHYLSELDVARVRQAIQRLPLHFREIIVLREYEELSYDEIATVMQCAIGTVMSRLARARAKLRPLLSSNLRPLPKRD
jgi:RNA polymerase sigma-70 factor (ECF subfamily)